MAINFQDLSLREASLFENYSPNAYNDLLIALQIADERITNRIARTKGEWTRRKLNEIKSLINEEIGKAYGGLFEGMQKESITAAEIVASAAIGKATQLPNSITDDLINSNRNIQGYTFKELFKLNEDNHARQLRVLIASGVNQGLTTPQIIKEYDIKSNKLSKGQLKTDIFTTIAESRDKGRYVGYKELENQGVVTGYIYDATLDSRTTQYCREHDQRVYNEPIENIQDEIKVHFNCRSVFRPVTEDEPVKTTRPSQSGVVDEVNYEQWFLKQDKGLQRSTLTNRRYEDFLKGKYKVKSLTDLNKVTNLDTIKNQIAK